MICHGKVLELEEFSASPHLRYPYADSLARITDNCAEPSEH